GDDVRRGIGVGLCMRRRAQRYHEPQGRRTFRRQVRQRGPGRTEADLLEVEPVGPEVHVLERIVDAERERHRAEREQGAVVAEFGAVFARDLRDPREDPADAIEFVSRAERHGLYYNKSRAGDPESTEDWSLSTL